MPSSIRGGSEMARLWKTAALVGALSLMLVACADGGDGDGGDRDRAVGAGASPSVDSEVALVEFAECMRENGVPNYPDPENGFVFDNALDVDADPAVFDAAWEACESLLPSISSGDAGNPAGDAGWRRIVPGGDCQCADGSEFAFWERRADPDKVVFYLDGGGSCFDATACAFTGTAGESDYYNWSLEGENPVFPGGGILDLDRADNPLPTTRSSTWPRAPGTRISATLPASTRRS
jgi:hypothetical protein